MSQPIKYWRTKVEAERSASEIMDLVRKYGGTRFEMRWSDDGLEGVRFAIETEHGVVPVRLDAQVQRVAEIILESRPYQPNMQRTRTGYKEHVSEQAYRIAWRQLKDFVEQALLAVETGLFDVAAVFMAGVEVWDEEAGEVTTMAELASRRMSLHPGTGALALLPKGDS